MFQEFVICWYFNCGSQIYQTINIFLNTYVLIFNGFIYYITHLM